MSPGSAMRAYLNTAIDDAIDTAEGAHPSIIARRIRDAYPEEFAESAFESAEKWLRDQAHALLSARARTRQEALPGFELPSVFTVSDGEGGYRYVGMRRATLRDFDEHVEIRRLNAEAATAEYLLCSNQRRACRKARGAHDGMLVVDAIARLNAAQVQP